MLWIVGRVALPDSATGSLVDDTGKPARDAVAGSRLIAQPFASELYFQPRPSSVSYNAAGSGGSNWGASNPLLRDRVARTLGPIVRFSNGTPVAPSIDKWFQDQSADDARKPVEERFVVRWSTQRPAVAEQWLKDNIDAAVDYLGEKPDPVKAASNEWSLIFFRRFASTHPGTWPTSEDAKDTEGKPTKRIKAVREGSDVQSYLFDPWLAAHPGAELQAVPADRVMASGSGLDPHITRANAQSQLDGIVAAWVTKTGRDRARIAEEIGKILDENEKAETPLGGLIGAPLVNVLEVNLALKKQFTPSLAARTP
jgi:K+-transporting ATPase ATPase C chain